MTNEDSLEIGLVVGWLLTLAGIGLLVWGWIYDATIPATADLYGLGDRSFNLGLIVTKLSLLITGAGFLAGGCGLLGGQTKPRAPSSEL